MLAFAWAAPAPNPQTYLADGYPLATAYSFGTPTYYAAPYPYSAFSYNTYNYRSPYYAYSSPILI